MAEKTGFEPAVPCDTSAFKADAFNHSATSPRVIIAYFLNYAILLCMKYIGIDYGTKKTGIAISDALGSLAFPRDVLVTNAQLVTVIAGIIKDENITGVIMGESKNLKGEFNKVATNAHAFAKELQKHIDNTVNIIFEDERFSTKQAKTLPNEGKARGKIANTKTLRGWTIQSLADSQAAAIILQSFLDKQKHVG